MVFMTAGPTFTPVGFAVIGQPGRGFVGLMKQLLLDVDAPSEIVVEMAQAALTHIGAVLEKVDADNGLIMAKQPAGLATYGQVLRLWIVGQDAGTRLTLQSELVASFQAIDWGKNDGNLSAFTQRLSALLNERGYPHPRVQRDPVAAPPPASSVGPAQPAPTGAVVPAYTQPSDFFHRPAKDRTIAIFLEISFGLAGIAGMGWIYGGNTSTGLVLLVAVLLWDCLVTGIAALTGGISCLCTVPINIVIAAISAARLSNYTKAHPDIFSS
jgi:hypothetical protein